METDLKQLGQEWAGAELRGDVSALDSMLTDDFAAVGPRGFLLSKQQWLDRYRSGDLKHESFILDGVDVRRYGDAAVVTSRETTQSTYQGRDAGGNVRMTQVFVKQDGRWLLATVHLSPIAGPP